MKFVELCRACGVSIRPSESVDFTNDTVHIALADKHLLEEATVACLAKDSESEIIVRKLFHLFFTGRPLSEGGEIHAELASVFEEKEDSETVAFTDQNRADSGTSSERERNNREAADGNDNQSEPKETMPNQTGFPSAQHQQSNGKSSTAPQKSDRAELLEKLAKFAHDNLSGQDLEQITDLLENLRVMPEENAERMADGEGEKGRTGEQGMKEDRNGDEKSESGDSGQEGVEEGRNEQQEGMEDRENSQAEDAGNGVGEDGKGPQPTARNGENGKAEGVKGQHSTTDNSNGRMGKSTASRFNLPLSPEAAQSLARAFVSELVNGEVKPSLGGQLARLMNPEQGRNLIQQHLLSLDLWFLTEQEHARLLESLEYVVGRLLLQEWITPAEFVEYSKRFDEHLKAQTTVAGAGAETHLKSVEMLERLLIQYRSKSGLQGAVVRQLSTAMYRLLSRRMPIYAKSASGVLDVRKTVRQSLQYGGIPMEFIYREKVLWEDIVLALDTSGSQIWWAVSAMLFAGALEKTARRLRVYSFTSDIVDVTKYVPFPEKFVAHLDNFAGYSNYETSFQQLLDKAPISARTILIIVGDCRDYQGAWRQKSPDKYGQRIGPHSGKLMEKLVTRSHEVIVMNPEEQSKWGVGDSAVHDYELAGAIVKFATSPLHLAEQLQAVRMNG